MLGYPLEQGEAAQNVVVELAKKYKQGAIFSYEPFFESSMTEPSKFKL